MRDSENDDALGTRPIHHNKSGTESRFLVVVVRDLSGIGRDFTPIERRNATLDLPGPG